MRASDPAAVPPGYIRSTPERLAERRRQVAEWRAAGIIVAWEPEDHPEPDHAPGPFGVPLCEWHAAGGWRGFAERAFCVGVTLFAFALILGVMFGIIPGARP